MRSLVPRTLDALWSDWERLFELPWVDFPWMGRNALPPVDIEETDDAYVVTAELPGFDKKDIEIELTNNVLTIRGEKVEREGRRFLRRERSSSVTRFERRFRFPDDIDHNGVTAEFNKGELVVRLPKSGSATVRKIPLN